MITRVAPSPTGFFHIGTLRTALFNYLKAKANGGKFILRIDDTDQDRNKPEYVDYIYDKMTKYGLGHDLTFRQSDRLDRYLTIADKIGKVTDNGHEVDMGDYKMVILRKNGFPTYNFCSILDDYDYNVTNIIRGVDHISNLDKQKKLWDLICSVDGNKDFPEVQHAGLLFSSGRKISKRDKTSSLDYYDDFNIDAVLNWVFRLGWSHPDPNFDKTNQIMGLNDQVLVFNDGHINSNNCSIDMNKLNFLNKKWSTRKQIA